MATYRISAVDLSISENGKEALLSLVGLFSTEADPEAQEGTRCQPLGYIYTTKSPHDVLRSPIAQSVERTAVNREVAGSRPAGRDLSFAICPAIKSLPGLQ